MVTKNNSAIRIGETTIGDGQDIFVIAELGINHNGDFETAKEMIKQAKWSGASAVKFQTYVTEKRVSKDSPIFDILKQCELSFSQQKQLFNFAREQGLEVFSTPFDNESVDFLSSIDVSCFKIASFDIVNRKLLSKVAKQGKPIIMSRGMADKKDIDNAVNILNENNIKYIILHCISAYPVKSYKSLNLKTILSLKEYYKCLVGYSDHTLGIEAIKYAVALGATVIEKHFTLSKDSKGPDHQISSEPLEMKEIVLSVKYVQEILGNTVLLPVLEEKDILQYRRNS